MALGVLHLLLVSGGGWQKLPDILGSLHLASAAAAPILHCPRPTALVFLGFLLAAQPNTPDLGWISSHQCPV